MEVHVHVHRGLNVHIHVHVHLYMCIYMYMYMYAPHMAALYLELISLDDPALYVILDLPQDGEHRDVGLAGTGRSRDEQVLTGVVGNIKHD